MKARAASAQVRRGRWALSFADLTLLLLGFFVLLQASNGRQQEIVGGLAQQFGSPAVQSERLVARDLFQRGEALLTPAGEKIIRAAALRFSASGKSVEVRSIGLDPATSRFDGWDLAAARLGAIARALVAAGVPANRVVIRGLDQQNASRAGQQILIRAK